MKWIKCILGHNWALINQFLVLRKEHDIVVNQNDLVTCLLMRCEKCNKIKQVKLKGICEVPEHAMREI
jgi:hypothetical protein